MRVGGTNAVLTALLFCLRYHFKFSFPLDTLVLPVLVIQATDEISCQKFVVCFKRRRLRECRFLIRLLDLTVVILLPIIQISLDLELHKKHCCRSDRSDSTFESSTELR